MKSNLWPLLKVQWVITWRSATARFTGTSSRWGLLLLPLLLLSLLPMVVTLTAGWAGLYTALSLTGQGHVLLTLALTGGQLIALVFGVLYLISAFYFSQDLRILVPLPLRPGEIVVAKFAGILVGEYLSMAPVVLPALAVYGISANAGWLYIPFAVVIYLLLPVVPLVLASLFTILLMRATNMRRNRDLLRVFGALIGIGLVFLLQFMTRLQDGGRSQQAVRELITQQQPLIQSVSKYAITSVWATDALRVGSPSLGLPPFLAYIALVALALIVLFQVAEYLFFGGLLGGDETRSAGRLLSQGELRQATEQVRSPLWALFLREVRLLNRTPSFLMAAVLPPLLMPFFLILPLTQKDGPFAGNPDLSRFSAAPWAPLILLGALLFLNTVSAVPSSAISREGRWFWISRSLPVAPRVQVQAKVLHSLLFSLINLAIMTGTVFYLHLATPRNLAVLLVGGLLVSILASCSGLLIDLIHPRLKWTDPQQAMKGSLNSLLALVINLVLGGALGVIAALLHWLAPTALLPGLLAILALLCLLLGNLTLSLADRRYMEYE